MTVLALMYHRVVPRRPDTACYFQRGTAVEPDIFAAHIAWLSARYPIIAPGQISRWPLDQPAVILTFDDGYRDVLDVVDPVCQAYEAPYSVFPIAGHLADGSATWFDRYYDLVQRARWTAAVRRRLAAAFVVARDAPAPVDDLRWWVRGPLKAALSATPEHREAWLLRLAACLGVEPNADLARYLYLSVADLQRLVRRGVTIGGHGFAHARMSDVAPEIARFEVAGARELLRQIGAAHASTYAYPDGGYNAAAMETVRAAGFQLAFTVEAGVIDGQTDPLRLPRVIARNRPPHHVDASEWRSVLVPGDFAGGWPPAAPEPSSWDP